MKELNTCKSGQCERLVSPLSLYCCGACCLAWESSPRYEPHAHSEGCDSRYRDRRPRHFAPEEPMPRPGRPPAL